MNHVFLIDASTPNLVERQRIHTSTDIFKRVFVWLN